MVLQGKTMLVVGASSGIGEATAHALANVGASCWLTARNENKLNVLQKRLAGVGHQTHCGDLTNPVVRESLVQQLPVLDGVALSIGVLETVPVGFLSQPHLHRLFDSNLFAPLLLANDLVRFKKLSAGAALVFMSSVTARFAYGGNTAYSASKGALEAAVQVLAVELARKKIRVNSVRAGMVQTPLWRDKAFDSDQLDRLKESYPLGLGEATDVAAAVLFLLSDEARWITGNHLVVDGGYSILA